MLLNYQILKWQAQLMKQGWQGFPKCGDGESPCTSWKFAHTPLGEISPTKFFLIPYQKFQHVKYYLPRINTSRNIKLKKCKFSFLAFLANFLKFPLKLTELWRCSYEVLKTILHYITFICWRTCEKNSSLNFMFSIRLVSRLLKSPSGRHNSLP